MINNLLNPLVDKHLHICLVNGKIKNIRNGQNFKHKYLQNDRDESRVYKTKKEETYCTK